MIFNRDRNFAPISNAKAAEEALQDINLERSLEKGLISRWPALNRGVMKHFRFNTIYTINFIEANSLKFKYSNHYEASANLFDNSLSYFNNELSSNQNVFIVVLEPGRVRKIQILEYTNSKVVFRHGNIDNTDTVTVTMPLNPNNNYNYY